MQTHPGFIDPPGQGSGVLANDKFYIVALTCQQIRQDKCVAFNTTAGKTFEQKQYFDVIRVALAFMGSRQFVVKRCIPVQTLVDAQGLADPFIAVVREY